MDTLLLLCGVAVAAALGSAAVLGARHVLTARGNAQASRHELVAERVDFGAPSQARARARADDTQAIAVVRGEMAKARLLLAAPPTIDGVTLRDYLTHHATKRCPHPDPDHAGNAPLHAGTWPCVVEDLYTEALGSSLVAPYFDGVDAHGLAELKIHFLSALITVTHVGLYLDVAERLEARHAHLGITEAVFDATTGVLVQSIASYATTDVMNHVLPQMAPLVRELRKRLVTA